MIYVYGWNLTKDDTDLLHRLINSTFGENKTRTIQDLFVTSKVTAIPGDLVIATGMRAYNLVSAELDPMINITKIPTPKELSNTTGSSSSRTNTFKLLKGLAESKPVVDDKQLTISAEELKSFSIALLTKLKASLEDKGLEYWIGTTNAGKKIAITLNPNTKIPDCNTSITFEEIIAAKFAIEVLNLKEMNLILGDKKDD